MLELQQAPWRYRASLCHGAFSASCCFLIPMTLQAEYEGTILAVVLLACAGALCSTGSVTSRAASSWLGSCGSLLVRPCTAPQDVGFRGCLLHCEGVGQLGFRVSCCSGVLRRGCGPWCFALLVKIWRQREARVELVPSGVGGGSGVEVASSAGGGSFWRRLLPPEAVGDGSPCLHDFHLISPQQWFPLVASRQCVGSYVRCAEKN